MKEVNIAVPVTTNDGKEMIATGAINADEDKILEAVSWLLGKIVDAEGVYGEDEPLTYDSSIPVAVYYDKKWSVLQGCTLKEIK